MARDKIDQHAVNQLFGMDEYANQVGLAEGEDAGFVGSAPGGAQGQFS
jgi:hypothetical protein